MKLKLLFLSFLFNVSIGLNAQLPKWILGSSEQTSSGTFHPLGMGNLNFYEVNFNGTLGSTQRTIGSSIQKIKSVGSQDVMQTAVDTTTNTVLFYAFTPSLGPWNGGFPVVQPDTVYFAAYDSFTSADEVFGKIPTTGWGASVLESELVKKPGSSSEYYFIYKTQATSLYLDYIRYVTIDAVNKTVSAPINLVSSTKSGEGMAVSQLNCITGQRWLFLTRPEPNGDITLQRCAITNTGVSLPSNIYTISIPGNSTSVVAGVEISPTNNYLAVANYNNTTVSKNMILFDYNNLTGTVSNERAYTNQATYPFVTMEFSPNGSRVYILQGGSGSFPTVLYNCPVVSTNYTVTAVDQMTGMTINNTLALELAYDGKIYVNPGQSSNFMYIINNPNSNSLAATTTISNFFGTNQFLGSGFPDQVDGDRNFTGTINVSVSSTPSSLCSGQTTTITASGGTSYQWSGGSTATTSVITASPLNTSTYIVTASSGICSGSDSIIIQVNPTPTISISGNQDICSGQNIILTGGTATNYSWSTGATTNTISVSPNSTTNYTLTGSNGTCTGSAIATVSVTSTPTLTVSGVTSICNGQSTVLTGSGATNYTWSTGATTNTISVSPASTASYTLTGANGTCVTNTVVTVSVANTPTLNISGITNICSGQSTILIGATAPNYSWSTGATTNTISVSPNSTTTYTLTGTNGACVTNTVVTVSVTNTPTLTISGTTNICSGQSTILTGATAANYSWSTGATTNTISVSPASTTSYTLTGANGACVTNTVVTITVSNTPTLTISGTTSICSGQTITLTGATATNYSWSTGATTNTISVSPASTATYTLTGTNGACITNAVATVSVTATPTLNISGTTGICSGQTTVLTGTSSNGNYTWTPSGIITNTISVSPNSTTSYTLTSTNGVCSSSDVVTVNVTPTPTLTISGAIPICSGQTIVLAGASATNYTWSPSGITTNTISVSPMSTTTYTLTGANGSCITNTVATVSVTPTPTLNISGAAILCNGNNTVLTASGANSYQWGGGFTGTSPSITVSPTVTTIYYVQGTNGVCTDNDTISVQVITIVPALFTFSKNQCTSLEWNFNSVNNTPSMIWYFGDGTNSTTINPTHLYQSGTYTVILVTNPSTICADTTSQNIIVVDSVQNKIIPNIFTPNNDGINDELIFSGLSPCTEYTLEIYNRWGQKVFETDKPKTVFWNGIINTKNEVVDGTYYFLLVPENNLYGKTIKGNILVIR